MWELDYKESWALKNWCFWTVVLEKTLESPLDCKEIQLVHPKGNQSWISIGRTDAETETPILWPPDVKNWLTGKDPIAGKDWRQEEKGTTEDELVTPSNHLILYRHLLLLIQYFPASGSFPMSQFFASGGQNIGVSASASVLPLNIQDWFLLGWTGWISLKSKGFSRVFSNTTVQKHQFFGTQSSLWSNSHIRIRLWEKP